MIKLLYDSGVTDPDRGPLPSALLATIHPLQRQLNTQRTLSMGKLGILRHLAENDRASTGELAVRINVSPQAISLAARELEDLGLIERARDERDRRRWWFVITTAGRERCVAEHRAGETWLARTMAERLTEAEVQSIAAAVPALAKLTETLRG